MPDHAWVSRLGVADLPSLVDLLVGEPNVRDGWIILPTRKVGLSIPASGLNLTPLLRRVVLIRQAGLGLGLEFKDVG